jgi:hypothetical protein
VTYKPETLIALVTLLSERTEAGDLEWRDVADAAYAADTSTGSIVIGTRDDDGQAPYKVSLFDPNGDEIVTFGQFEGLDTAVHTAVGQLYRAIRVTKSDVQQSLESFVKEFRRRPQIF